MIRISSGVKGLDDLISGGFPEGSIILISGKAGTGKSSFCASFLYEGFKNNEAGIYVTTELSKEEIKKDLMQTFGWNFEEFENKGLLSFIEIEPTFSTFSEKGFERDFGSIVKIYVYDLLEKISKEAKRLNAKRLVIDSITLIESFIKDEYLRRAALISFVNRLKRLRLTTLITSQILHINPNSLSISGILEFLVDGIIKLDDNPEREEFKRTLTILKMRRTKHSEYVHAFEITSEGIRVLIV